MCRLGALSDACQAAALVEWLGSGQRAEREAAPAERLIGQVPPYPQPDARRATG